MTPTPFPGFLRRTLRFALERALRLYYTARDPATPRRSALMFLLALVYLVVPLDLIPDFVPLLGLADDASGLLGTGWLLARHTTGQHRQLARQRANRMLGILESPP